MLILLFMSLEFLNDIYLLLSHVTWNDNFEFQYMVTSKQIHVVVLRGLKRRHAFVFQYILGARVGAWFQINVKFPV